MGCIPSKSAVEFEVVNTTSTGAKVSYEEEIKRRNPFRSRKGHGPPSPVVEGERPPWLQSRAVLTEKGGILMVVEPPEK